MTADAIARVLAEPGEKTATLDWVEPPKGGSLAYEHKTRRVKLADILAADRQAQRERHAALAREIGQRMSRSPIGEAIARAILEDKGHG